MTYPNPRLSRQANLVLNHLRTEAHLTSWQAEGVYRIRRLASRVSELKNAGYAIEKRRCEDATGQPYTRYSFSKAQKRSPRPLNEPVKAQPRFSPAEACDAYRAYCVAELGLTQREADEERAAFAAFLEARA